MTAARVLASQQDGLAMILAAVHEDHEAMTYLVRTRTIEEIVGAAMYCAYFAAHRLTELRDLTNADYEHHLRELMLKHA